MRGRLGDPRSLVLGLASLGVAAGCAPESPTTEAAPPRAFETDASEPVALKTIDAVPVEGASETVSLFFVATRAEHLTQYPCSYCHDDVAGSPAPLDGDARTMHADIELKHAAAHVMDCFTCHHEDNLDALRLNDGSPVGFDHSYRMCTQCHFEQGRDWVGGAHGKRVGGWQGKRVVTNCTGCHDPHAPAFDQRWPRKFPRIPRRGAAHGHE